MYIKDLYCLEDANTVVVRFWISKLHVSIAVRNVNKSISSITFPLRPVFKRTVFMLSKAWLNFNLKI